MGSKVGTLQDHPSGIALAWGTGETSDYLLSEVLVLQRKGRASLLKARRVREVGLLGKGLGDWVAYTAVNRNRNKGT